MAFANTTGGTFDLKGALVGGTTNVTGPITWSANPATLALNIQDGLDSLPAIGLDNQLITGMTGTGVGPIVVTTTSTAGLVNGATVFIHGANISGSAGPNAANGYYTIGGLTATSFELLGTSGNGTWGSSPARASWQVTGLTGNGVTPIKITTATTAGLSNGQTVYITGVQGNTAANGFWTVSNLTATTFTLNGSTGNGTWTTGTGTWTSNGTWSTGTQVTYNSGLGAYTVIFNGPHTLDTFLPTMTADVGGLLPANGSPAPAITVKTPLWPVPALAPSTILDNF